MPANLNDIFHGVTKAPVRNFVGELVRAYRPEAMVHPCVGRYGALSAAVKAGIAPTRHYASDLNLYTTVIGCVLDPEAYVAGLDLVPSDEVAPFFEGADLENELNYAARVLLGMKYVQLQPINRYLEGLRRELRVRREHHVEYVERRLTAMVQSIGGIHYRPANLWDVIAELEAEPPAARSMLYMSMNWYSDDFSKQFARAESAFAWPGLVGREFSPDNLTELLDRANAIPNLATVAHVGGVLSDLVPDSFTPAMSYIGGRNTVDRVYSNVPNLPRYAPQKVRQLNPKPVPLFTDEHELTAETKLEIVPIDEDTALYLRDLFVHRLGTTVADTYLALTLDGLVVGVYGLGLAQAMGASGKPSGYVQERFGVVRTSRRYPRFNRLSPLAMTSGDFKKLLLATQRQLHGRELLGMQTTDIRHYRDSKNKRGVYGVHHIDQMPNGLWKIVLRGPFRDDTWEETWAKWWTKWGAAADKQQEVTTA